MARLNDFYGKDIGNSKDLQSTARDKLLKAVESFLKTEMILSADLKDNTEKMKKRVNYFVDKITEMKKDLK